MEKNIMRNRVMPTIVRTLLLVFVLSLGYGKAEAKKEIELQHTARYFASRAESYEDAGAWEAAKREIDEGLRLYPDDPDLRYLNGRYYYKAQGDLQQARYNLVKAIQENDQHFYAKRILVDVEDDSKHFSSAICYINELLEFQPYDRDLWRRKISLYRKIGQKSEADDALARLAQIYPNDTVLKKELNNLSLERWNNRSARTNNTPDALIKDLEILIDDDPYELDYYLELIKNYTLTGQIERAIGTANRGLNYFPNNAQLVQKAAQLMAEVGDYTRAMSFLKEHKNTGALYNDLMRMAADDARWKDAYESNGRLYATTKDKDALNYLVNTSIVRGYYPDAIEYLHEAYKRYGRTPQLLMKQYGLEKRFGNKDQCLKLLEELYTMTPNEPDIVDDYTDMIIALANHDMETEQWIEANASLDKVLSMIQPDNERWPGLISKKITVLGHMNRLNEARSIYLRSSERNPQYRDRFAYAYEELAAARLKKLIENEEYETALSEAQDLMRIVEESEAALRTCINMSQTLGKKDLFHQYADMGYEKFPNSPYFIIKKAIALREQGKIEEAMALLKPDQYNDEYLNPQMVSAYTGLCEEYVTILIKDHKSNEALEWIDRGLKFDPNNKELLYAKGLAYEQLKDYPKAYEYLSKYYNPTNAEQEEWEQHMRYLRWRSFRNHVDISYTAAFYDTNTEELASIGHLYSVASISYSHLFHRNTIMGQISYKGLDGFMDYYGYNTGGAGLEFLAQWDHDFGNRWTMMLNGSYATRYFNKVGANLGFYFDCGRGWTAGLKAGYRYTPPTYVYKGDDGEAPVADEYRRYHILMLTPSVEKAWDRIRTSVSGDIVGMKTGLYYNVNWKGKLFINEDNISAVGLMAGFGSFPELKFFDQTALSSISHTNATVGAEFIYLITKHLSFSINGNWNTYYNPQRLEDGGYRSAYRNVFSVNVGLQTAF